MAATYLITSSYIGEFDTLTYKQVTETITASSDRKARELALKEARRIKADGLEVGLWKQTHQPFEIAEGAIDAGLEIA